ncbi:hypothetical protein DERF_000846 [Dermatophagoides farinae]|uniref:Uncharacterized protein n=1 Tax=Dermatophagoides farinae TaxID=6954 RepID=A0A922IB14_DERFA|nr:hypothetical protein DERF_000846 [Dermatophagoides farinae]
MAVNRLLILLLISPKYFFISDLVTNSLSSSITSSLGSMSVSYRFRLPAVFNCSFNSIFSANNLRALVSFMNAKSSLIASCLLSSPIGVVHLEIVVVIGVFTAVDILYDRLFDEVA